MGFKLEIRENVLEETALARATERVPPCKEEGGKKLWSEAGHIHHGIFLVFSKASVREYVRRWRKKEMAEM